MKMKPQKFWMKRSWLTPPQSLWFCWCLYSKPSFELLEHFCQSWVICPLPWQVSLPLSPAIGATHGPLSHWLGIHGSHKQRVGLAGDAGKLCGSNGVGHNPKRVRHTRGMASGNGDLIAYYILGSCIWSSTNYTTWNKGAFYYRMRGVVARHSTRFETGVETRNTR